MNFVIIGIYFCQSELVCLSECVLLFQVLPQVFSNLDLPFSTLCNVVLLQMSVCQHYLLCSASIECLPACELRLNVKCCNER